MPKHFEFPEILVFKSNQHYAKHDVTHFINIEGHSCHAISRRLSPEQQKIAEREFKMMETKGIIRRSKSPWSSPYYTLYIDTRHIHILHTHIQYIKNTTYIIVVITVINIVLITLS